MKPHESHETESRWHRPNLYMTIVSIYLLILAAVVSSVIGYFSVGAGVVPAIMTSNIIAVFAYMPNLLKTPAVLSWLTFFIAGGPIIWVVPSVTGAALLLQRRKEGALISLGALILATISSSILIFFGASLPALLAGISTMISTGIMYVLLIIGAKCVQWR